MSSSVKIKTLTIDERQVGAREDQTILEVARENGIKIPTLCYLKGLTPYGGCRMCIVEIAGSPKLLPSCMTAVEEGMVVTTNSDRIKKYRRSLLELYFSERSHVCSVCATNGYCELQSMAQEVEMTHVHFPYMYPHLDVDATHERFVLDHNRCISCTRCIRVCDEIEGAHTLDIKDRGIDVRIITDLDHPWGESETCTQCGKCVHVCPTGALIERGKSVGEMTKRKQLLPYLTKMREAHK